MKTIIFSLLLIVLAIGCGVPTPPKPSKFFPGEKVAIVVNDRPAVVVRYNALWNAYEIRYSNNLGELEIEMVKEFEIQKRD